MRVLVTGATGFVGRALCLRLERDGHQVLALVRAPARARNLLSAQVELLELPAASASAAELERQLETCDAIVHLAGEPVVGKRWSAARRTALHDSRIGLANRLVAAMAKCTHKPRVFVGASAVGYYGNRGDEILGEDAKPGDDFLAQLCVDWEQSAESAKSQGARVVCLRTGIVLGPEGGVLGAMQLPFKLCVGGRIGSGRQYIPWIHLDDLLEMYLRALVDPKMSGAFNATAPTPVTNAEFTRALGQALGRPTIFPVPKFALHAALGEAASALLASQRAVPTRFLALGFRFAHSELDQAMRAALQADRSVRISSARNLPEHAYVRERRPTHVLEATTLLLAPLEEVAAFFGKPENLGTLTPPKMVFRIDTPQPIQMQQGTIIDYTIRLWPLTLRWRTVIEVWNGASGFADAQYRGPYRCWWHEHTFERHHDGTLMRDRVFFAAPFGWIGRAAVGLFIAPQLRWIFGYRTRAIAWRFGVGVPTI